MRDFNIRHVNWGLSPFFPFPQFARLAAILLFAAGCGKVGAPLPPIIRTPQAINDLSAVQNGYDIILTWTNPPRYIDGNPATDLSKVRVLRNGVDVAAVD